MEQKINEEMHIEKEWFAEAKKQRLMTLPDFINHVMNDYEHDYGTVCHAIAACALAATWAANNEDGARGGITGFQAGFVMWDFIRQFMYEDNKCGLRIIDYDKMLYPQYEDFFGKHISPEVHDALMKRSEELLKEKDHVHPDVIKHWKAIATGHMPFGYVVAKD